MRKALVLLLVLAVGVFTQAELLNNPESFEDGMPGWGTWGSGSSYYSWKGSWVGIATILSGGAYDGDKYLHMETEWDWWNYYVAFAHNNLVNAGDEYKLTVAIRNMVSAENTIAGLKLEWYTGLDKEGPIYEDQLDIPVEQVPDAWTVFELTKTAPEGANYLTTTLVSFGPLSSFDYDYLILIPEPATIGLLGLGALLLRRRKT